MGIVNYGTSDSDAATINLGKSKSGTAGTPGVTVGSNSILGGINFAGDDGTDVGSIGATIQGRVDGTPGANSIPGRLVFYTTPTGASSTAERMRIKSDGGVSLGGAGFAYQTLGINGALQQDSNLYEAVSVRGQFQEVSTSANSFVSSPTINLPTGTDQINNFRHFQCNPQATTTNGLIGSQYGFICEANLTAANNNYAFYSNVAAGSGRWNFYANGDAANYFAGTVNIGTQSTIIPASTTSEGFSFRTSVPYLAMSRQGNPVLILQRTSTNGEIQQFYRQTTQVGDISVTGSTTSYNTSSDYRLKENVVGLTNASDRIKALKPCRFNFIAEPDKTVDGFLAHEAQEVVPEAVTGEKDGEKMQSIDTSKLVPLLTAALQESIARIDELQKEVNALKSNQVN